jgi:hypothetical protein
MIDAAQENLCAEIRAPSKTRWKPAGCGGLLFRSRAIQRG